MRETIKAIEEKYNDFVFKNAILELMQLGSYRLRDIDVEKECRLAIELNKINNTSGKGVPIVSVELRNNIFRCAAELSHIDPVEILKYIQTDVKIPGIKTNPGRFVKFNDRKTGRAIITLLVDKPLNKQDIDRISDTANAIRPGKSTDAFDICEALTELGFVWDKKKPDYIIEI